jgi:hypothetical protein
MIHALFEYTMMVLTNAHKYSEISSFTEGHCVNKLHYTCVHLLVLSLYIEHCSLK